MYSTITEKILKTRVLKNIKSIGEYDALNFDFIMGHDPLIAIIVDEFKKNNFKINKLIKNKCIFIADHFAPPSNINQANILKTFLDFSFQNKIKNLHLFNGICHQLLVENKNIKPFSFVIGSDSHTCTVGGISCLGLGYGSFDIMHALVKGYIYEKNFPAVKVIFEGRLPNYLDARDIFLTLIKKIGEGNLNKHILEFFDINLNFSIDDRCSISCSSVDTSAITGIFSFDQITYDYFKNKIKNFNKSIIDKYYEDISFNYKNEIKINLSKLKPKIAYPDNFSKVKDVKSIANEKIKVDQVFIGSCASGRLTDFKRMCQTIDKIENFLKKRGIKKQVLKNKKVKLIITPSSQSIYLEAIKLGYIEKLINFGAVITNPSCGPCGGIDKGILAKDEICVTTSTRNFKGRMGDFTSKVFVASAITAILTAYNGYITNPLNYFLS